jgi:glucosamine--fructose-6-phosphate aminotransferase (isomerizing)
MCDKNESSIQEIKARDGRVIAIGSAGHPLREELYDDVLYVPDVHPAILPIITVLPLQLFAYYVALERHCDVDKPRNLAKSVTVE